MKLSILIPVFNEKATVAEVIKQAAAVPLAGFEKEIIAVDDGSNDGTKEILEKLKKKLDFILLRHSINLGKGVAIKTALTAAGGNLVIIQDADLEYAPRDWPFLLAAQSQSSPVIYGSRYHQKTGYRHYAWGAKFLTFLVNLLFGSCLTDVYTGYKLMPLPLLKSLDLQSRGFELEMEITVKILQRKIPIKEIPVHYLPRRFSAGKKIRWRDGWLGLQTLWRLKRGKKIY